MADLERAVDKVKRRKRTKTGDKENHEEETMPLSPPRSKERTKGSIENLLKQATEGNIETTETTKKKKKKPKPSLQKPDDDDDTALIKNKTEKTPKKRLEKSKLDGSENPAFEGESSKPVKSAKKKKPKKEEQEETKTEDEDVSKETAKGKRIPRRKKSPQRSSSKEVLEKEDEEEEKPVAKVRKKKKKQATGGSQDEAEKEDEVQDETIEADKKGKKPRRKKKDKAKEDETAETVEDDVPEEEKPPPIPDEGKVLGVNIHRTDKLKTDLSVSHPLVRVHVVNSETGTYLPKQSSGRPVTSYYETQNDHVNFVLPMMSQPYDFKKHQSTIPVWEELILFNENYNYFLNEESNVILFFELLDFLTMNQAKERYDYVGQDGGWHHIAWGFLKLVGKNGKLNCDRKVRLQLYEVPRRFRPSKTQVEVFQWWFYGPKFHYPSTMYVTVKGLIPPDTVQPAIRSMFATQKEAGTVSYKELKKTLTGRRKDGRDEDKQRTISSWGRLPGQMCKIPNSLSLSLPAGRKGCFIIRFSHDGRFLACGCHDKQDYPILVYEIPSGKLHGQFEGHYGIIYDLCWSRKDKFLLSSSGDGTSRVWTIGNYKGNADKVLPHPAFVYTAKYHPRVRTVIVTGGYDCVIRIWDVKSDGNHGQLVQELDEHLGYISTLCFDEDGQKLYSGDSTGRISVWNVYVTEQPTRKGFLKNWSKFKDIEENELKGSVINNLQVYNGDRRLLIHTRDNVIRTMDLRVYAVMQRYMGALNFREQIRSCVTPCGSFVISGSEDDCAYVWNTETGDQVAIFSELKYKHTVSDSDFHPHDHMVAFCSFGDNHPVLVYTFDPKVARMEAGLEVTSLDGRPGSPSMKPVTIREDPLANNWMKTDALSDDFATTQTVRFGKAVKKLNTVLNVVSAFQEGVTPRAVSPDHGMYPTIEPTMMTWGSTFDYTRSASPQPGMFSPHAPTNLNTSIQQQQFSSQYEYFKHSSGWRPGVQQAGRSSSPYLGQQPSITLDASQGRPQFSFQGVKESVTDLKQLRLHTPTQKVVALYDYQAARSDELTLMRGDVINVLYKDSDNWWMGELSSGQQGFFPSNYVAEQAAGAVSDDESNDDTVDVKESRAVRAKTTAVISDSGELKFVSESEETPKKKNVRSSSKNRRGSREMLLESASSLSGHQRRSSRKTQETVA
ncbi:jouberin-like isoform X2 [Tubulanus polymorphus]|uniref:jouberin-like isoform X2 n=1 Tax=Tubulanus polymorphus TaxID=672921 RepID=UPI003DA5A60D